MALTNMYSNFKPVTSPELFYMTVHIYSEFCLVLVWNEMLWVIATVTVIVAVML